MEASHALVPEETGASHTTPGDARAITGWNGASAAPRWIGVIPYEALRGAERPRWTRCPDDRLPAALSLPEWRRYAAIVRIDHLTGDVAVEADDPASAAELARAVAEGTGRTALGAFSLHAVRSDEPDEAHRRRIREALRLIAAGDLYEVNLARRLGAVVRGDPVGLFAALLEAAPATWGFYQDLGQTTICGASPELALSVRRDVLRSCPVKGTRPRGRDADADARLAAALAADPKEHAELVMAIDVHRNDLGRVARPGTVRVLGEPRVIPGRTVWSRMAEVVALRSPGSSLEAIVRAVLPCGSVTGAPKVRAMEAIACLEPWRRSAYTGAFGFVTGDGDLCLAMAIRTLELGERRGPGGSSEAERSATYFTGGGIVADSDPERELEETRWKATQLERLSQPGVSLQARIGLNGTEREGEHR
ncbi:MAG: chorismate-binding protein [Myxococcota bacterium]|nr:chorismate-binding protein [Myxococcota bacterium]